jgi:hypothetical protein
MSLRGGGGGDIYEYISTYGVSVSPFIEHISH